MACLLQKSEQTKAQPADGFGNLSHQEMTMIATTLSPLKANTSAGVSASLIPTELGYASGLALLSRFSQLMQEDGLSTDTRRMQTDSPYAFEQLALAHTSTYESLRHCAMQVFALFRE
jgi:hypothetical protein